MDITMLPAMLLNIVGEAVSSVGTGEVGAGLGGLSFLGVLYKILSDAAKERKDRPIAQRLVNGNGSGNPGHGTAGTTIQMILTTLGQHTEEISSTRETVHKMDVALGRIEERLKMKREEDRP